MVSYLAAQNASADYVFWQRDHSDIRSYLIKTNQGMGAWFDSRWAAAEAHANDIFDPDQHDGALVADLFDGEVGVWPEPYFFQLSTAVVKDACTLYELFLETTANAVLHRYGGRLATLDSEASWHWPECALFFKYYMNINVIPPEVESILWLRNKMTHLRMRLRTEAGRIEFKQHLAALKVSGPPTADELTLDLTDHKPYFTGDVYISQFETLRILDKIGENVSTVASAAFQYEYGSATSPYLAAVHAGTPVTIPKFSNTKFIALI